MKWIKDEDGNSINLAMVDVIFIEDWNDDFKLPFKVYANVGKEKYMLSDFKTRKKALEFIDNLLKDA